MTDGDGQVLRISRVLALRCLHAGTEAARDGRSSADCPYRLNGSLEEQFAGLWWIRGWRRTAQPRPFNTDA